MTTTITIQTLEERVTALEKEMSVVKTQQDRALQPGGLCVWQKFVGVYKDAPEFEEAARFGQEYRGTTPDRRRGV